MNADKINSLTAGTLSLVHLKIHVYNYLKKKNHLMKNKMVITN